jgi:hypothetical protein
MSSLNLPDGIKKIGNSAFDGGVSGNALNNIPKSLT